MKKMLKFNKGFLPCAILSSVVIIAGIVGFFTKGINFGLDFKPGLIEEVRVAPPVAELTYNGSASITIDLSAGQMDVVISGAGVINETRSYNFNQYKTVGELATEINKIDGIHMTANNASFDSSKLFLNSAATNQITNSTLYIYPSGTSEITTDDIRQALDGKAGIEIKQLGEGADASYQIRKTVVDGESQSALIDEINNNLKNSFGSEKVAVIRTDFIGSNFSNSIVIKSIIMFVCTVLLIWLYAAIRFHWDFALGAIVALIHDTLIMMTFIIWSGMEFSATTLAAVLTIVGYSINATVVILDRIRYNLKYMTNVTKFNDILNQALSDTLLRSILTTATTLFAVLSLYIFTTGSIKDFSLALIVGLISGIYSSIYISSGLISLLRKNWKPEFGVHHSLKSANKNAVLTTE